VEEVKLDFRGRERNILVEFQMKLHPRLLEFRAEWEAGLRFLEMSALRLEPSITSLWTCEFLPCFHIGSWYLLLLEDSS
jgi:hypothetical protein